MVSKHCYNDAPSLEQLSSEAFKSSKVVCVEGISDTGNCWGGLFNSSVLGVSRWGFFVFWPSSISCFLLSHNRLIFLYFSLILQAAGDDVGTKVQAFLSGNLCHLSLCLRTLEVSNRQMLANLSSCLPSRLSCRHSKQTCFSFSSLAFISHFGFFLGSSKLLEDILSLPQSKVNCRFVEEDFLTSVFLSSFP